MSANFEYNLTTESEFEQMKQKNQELMEENQHLKKTLEEMIKINNELSETIEEFNNTATAKPEILHTFKQRKDRGSEDPRVELALSRELNQKLKEEVQYFKSLSQQSNVQLGGKDQAEIIETLEGLIESFKQTQNYYENELNVLCEEIEGMKTQWQTKIIKMEESYGDKMRSLEEVIKEFRKKEEIMSIIEKKIADEPKNGRKIMKKNSEIDTSSERKVNSFSPRDRERVENFTKEFEELKARERKLNHQLREKEQTIALYTDLLSKLKRKLEQKY